MTATTLWTNSNTSTNFGSQSVTLSNGISDFKYICVTVQYTTNNTNASENYYDTSDMTAYTENVANPIPCFGIFRSNNYYFRQLYYVDNTHVKFSDGRNINGSTVSTQNNTLIPVSIKGYK